MGSDTSPEILFNAIPDIAKEYLSLARLVLFGTSSLFASAPSFPNVEYVIVTDVITMDDDPLTAVRQKKQSSVNIGMKMLQTGQIDAFVSGGNTGAIMTSAKVTLSMLPKIARPALLTLLPAESKAIAVLDVGANVSYKPEHLYQFALMGIAYQKSRGITHPKVGLLNIGVEAQKGTPVLREAYQKLQELNQDSEVFVGNIEGKAAFQGQVDVLVTDGFTGNIFLKAAEGIASFICDQLEEVVPQDCSNYLREILATLRHKLHYAEFPGAILCGVNGIVVKCHGDFDIKSLRNGIKGAYRLIEHRFLEKIKAILKS